MNKMKIVNFLEFLERLITVLTKASQFPSTRFLTGENTALNTKFNFAN